MMHKNVGTARAAGCVGTHARAATSRRRHMCERRGNARTPLRWYCVSHYIGRSAFEFAPGSEIKSGDRQPDHYRRLLPPYFTHAHPARRRDELNLTSLASPRNAKPRNAKPRLATPSLASQAPVCRPGGTRASHAGRPRRATGYTYVSCTTISRPNQTWRAQGSKEVPNIWVAPQSTVLRALTALIRLSVTG